MRTICISVLLMNHWFHQIIAWVYYIVSERRAVPSMREPLQTNDFWPLNCKKYINFEDFFLSNKGHVLKDQVRSDLFFLFVNQFPLEDNRVQHHDEYREFTFPHE